jgi:hypothetical protein
MIYCAYVGHLAWDRKTLVAQLLAHLAFPDRVSHHDYAAGIRKLLTRVLLWFGFSGDAYMRGFRA